MYMGDETVREGNFSYNPPFPQTQLQRMGN